MQMLLRFLIIFLNISSYQCQSSICRTNCSMDASIDNGTCWREALVYRSTELIERLFSFSSLAVHVDRYRNHSNAFNDTMKFIDQSFENHLLNETNNSHLNMSLFTETKQFLLDLCRNLTLTQVESVKQIPSLSCSTSSCSSDLLNYTVIFITTTIITGLIFLICLVQFIQTRRGSSPSITVQHNGQLISPPSAANTTINT